MKVYTFESAIETRATMPSDYPLDVVKNEPMLFSCDREFAQAHGGEITRSFFDALPEDWQTPDIIFDSRVHMLMPGWFPCIPGWHLDDVPRSRPDGQPDHDDPEYKAEHILAIVGEASRTEFALGEICLTEPDLGKVVYGEWHERIESMLSGVNSQVRRHLVREGQLVQFDWRSFHRGTAATRNGWRWFGRITRNSKRPLSNEIRRQVQVYLPAVNVGW